MSTDPEALDRRAQARREIEQHAIADLTRKVVAQAGRWETPGCA